MGAPHTLTTTYEETDIPDVLHDDDVTGKPQHETESGGKSRKLHQLRESLRDIPWLTLVLLMLSNVFLGVIYYGFSFFYVELLETFKGNASDVAWIGSIQMCVSIGAGVLFSGAIRRLGNRFVTLLGTAILSVSMAVSSLAHNIYVLYVTFGLMSGLGLCALYMINVVVSQQQFVKHRTFLTSMMYLGYSVGQVISPVLVVHLVEAYTWRGAFLIIAGLVSHIFIAGLLLPEAPDTRAAPLATSGADVDPTKVTVKSESIKSLILESFDFSSLRYPPFLLYTLATFFVRSASIAFVIHIPNWMIHSGASRRDAAFMMMIQSVLGLALRPLVGLLSDCRRVDRMALHVYGGAFCVFLASFIIAFLPLSTGLVTSLVVFNIHNCNWAVLVPVVVVDLMGVKNVGQHYAVVCLFYSFAVLISPPFTGWIFDATKSYETPFYVNGGLGLFGVILLTVMLVLLKRKKSGGVGSCVFGNRREMSATDSDIQKDISLSVPLRQDVEKRDGATGGLDAV